MNTLWYETLNSAIRRTHHRQRIVRWLCRFLPLFTAGGYLCVLLLLLCNNDPHVRRFALVPATVFVLVTLLRRLLPFPRPYEVCDIEPLVPGKRQGRSLPSRHTASAAVIALAFWYLHPALGAVFSVLALGVALTRLLAGVHFVRDLLAAFGVALLIGVPGFWLL